MVPSHVIVTNKDRSVQSVTQEEDNVNVDLGSPDENVINVNWVSLDSVPRDVHNVNVINKELLMLTRYARTSFSRPISFYRFVTNQMVESVDAVKVSVVVIVLNVYPDTGDSQIVKSVNVTAMPPPATSVPVRTSGQGYFRIVYLL